MNQLTYIGIGLGVAIVIAYLYAAWRKKKKPDLATAANILLTTVGATGAVRLVGFVFTEQFQQMANAKNGSIWNISSGDEVFLLLGAMALAWVSCQSIWQGFTNL